MPFEAGTQADDGFGPATANEREAREAREYLATVFGSRWRGRVWFELSLRPMSPPQFAREVGGNVRYIRRCFRQLTDLGLIEPAETRHEGNRRGRAECVYRSIRRSYIADDVSAHLPLPVREDVSTNILTNYSRHLAQAIESGSFSSGARTHLSCDRRTLDRSGWAALMTQLEATLRWVPELTRAAAERTADSSAKPVPITVGILGFRSPAANRRHEPAPEAQIGDLEWSEDLSRDHPAPLLTNELARALRSPLRAQIMAEATERAVSPSAFAKKFGGELTYIGRCFRQLANAGCIELVGERRGGRGAGPAGVEHLYRSVRRARFPAEIWAIPAMLDDEEMGGQMKTYLGSVVEATAAGSFDADTDRHLSWDVIALDPPGWTELIAGFAELRRLLPTLGAGAKISGDEAGPEPDLIPTTLGLAAFRSPPRCVPPEASL